MNGRLWSGFLLSIIAVFSYAFVFDRWPLTRDIPWVNLLLFAAAIALLISGFRRARRKVAAGVVLGLGVALFVLFGVGILVGSKVPQSPKAPHVGAHAPDFALLDSNGHMTTLPQLLASAPRGVLLVFYRGYW